MNDLIKPHNLSTKQIQFFKKTTITDGVFMSLNDSGFRYRSVERHILQLIENQTLHPGDRLPSLRSLSVQMGVSISTVNQAYLELEDRGLVEARPRSGFFVRPSLPALPTPAPPRQQQKMAPVLSNRSQLIAKMLSFLGRQDLINLSVNCPDASLLPSKALARCMTQVLREDPLHAVSYETVQGNGELRRLLALRQAQFGLSNTPEEILVTSGTVEALYTALRAVTRPGDNVLIQSPTYYCFLQLLENCGLRAIELPSLPEEGMKAEDVKRALETFDVKACIVTSNFNNPDGATIPDNTKKEIVALLAGRGIPLIEDDIYGDLHFQGKRPSTFKQFDEEGLVIYCNSFSKALAPGYRVGWMSPGIYFQRALDIKTTTNVATATPNQMAVARFLAGGQYDRQVRQLRAAIHKQMQGMQLLLGRSFPEGTRVTRPEGGLSLWLELPGKIDGIDFFHRALAAGIGLIPGQVFSTQDRFNNYIRLSCTGIWNERVQQGIKTLGQLATEMASTARIAEHEQPAG